MTVGKISIYDAEIISFYIKCLYVNTCIFYYVSGYLHGGKKHKFNPSIFKVYFMEHLPHSEFTIL